MPNGRSDLLGAYFNSIMSMCSIRKQLIIVGAILSGTALCPAADSGFERELLPLLENHCFDCHDEDTQKGDLALDALNPDVVNGGDEAVWANAESCLESRWWSAARGSCGQGSCP